MVNLSKNPAYPLSKMQQKKPVSSPHSSSISVVRSVNRGFTLIELLSVIAIVGILVGILIPAISAVRMNGYKAETVSDLRQVFGAVSLYAAANGGTLPGPAYSGINAGYREVDLTLARYLAPYLTSTPSVGVYSTVEELLPSTFPNLSGNYHEEKKGPAYFINQYRFTEDDFTEPFGYPPAGNKKQREPKKIFMVPDPSRNVLLYGLDIENVDGSPGWVAQIAQSPLFGSERPFLYWDGHVEVSSRILPID